MSDDSLTDEGIESMVRLAEAAELLGESMGMKTSVALRFMLKSSQAFQQIKMRTLTTMLSPSKKVS